MNDSGVDMIKVQLIDGEFPSLPTKAVANQILLSWKFKLGACSNNVVDVEWSPDGSLLASCSLDNLIVIWTASGKQVKLIEAEL